MKVTTNYVHIGDGTVVEYVTTYAGDDVTIWVNILPPEPVESPAALPQSEADPAPVAAPLEMCAAAPAPTLKRRGLMGVIRATKTILFTVGGEALVYAANNLAGLNLPPGLGLVVGATAYGVQKAIKPDGLL